jgi:hypothetical protein
MLTDHLVWFWIFLGFCAGVISAASVILFAVHVKVGDVRGLVGVSDEPAPSEPDVVTPLRVYRDAQERSSTALPGGFRKPSSSSP